MKDRVFRLPVFLLAAAAAGFGLAPPAHAQCPPSFFEQTSLEIFDSNGPPLEPGDPIHVTVHVCETTGTWPACGSILELVVPLSQNGIFNVDPALLTFDPSFWSGTSGGPGCQFEPDAATADHLACACDAAAGWAWSPLGPCTNVDFEAHVQDPFIFGDTMCCQGDLFDAGLLGQGTPANTNAVFCDPGSVLPEIPSWGCTSPQTQLNSKQETCADVTKTLKVEGVKTVQNLDGPGFNPGDRLRYRICINNWGPPVDNFSLTDFLPRNPLNNMPVYVNTECDLVPPLNFVDESGKGLRAIVSNCKVADPRLFVMFSDSLTQILTDETVCFTFEVDTLPAFTDPVCNRAEFTFWGQFTPLPIPSDGETLCMVMGGSPSFNNSTKDASPRAVTAGQDVTFTIHVINSVAVAAPDLDIRDTFNPSCFDVSAAPVPVLAPAPTNWTHAWNGNELTIHIADPFPASGTLDATLTVPTTITASGECKNQAIIDTTFTGVPDVKTHDAQTPAEPFTIVNVTGVPQALVSATKTSVPAPWSPVQSGDTITYTITARETTGAVDATDAVVTDALPLCLDCTTFTAIQPSAPALRVEGCPGPSPTIRTDPLTIPRGGSQDVRFSIRVASGVLGSCCNQSANVEYLRVPGVPSSRHTAMAPGVCVDVQPPPRAMLTATKDSSPPPWSTVDPGDTVRFTIMLTETNNRGVDATQVSMTDNLQSCFDCTTFAAVTPPSLTIAGCMVQASGLTVSSGGTTPIMFDVNVSSSAIPGSSCCNDTVNVNYLGIPGDPTTADSTAAAGVCVSIAGGGAPTLYRDPADPTSYCNPTRRAALGTLFPIDQVYTTSLLPINIAGDLPATGVEPPQRSCQVFYRVDTINRIAVVKGDEPAQDVKVVDYP